MLEKEYTAKKKLKNKKPPVNVQVDKAQTCFSHLYIRRWEGGIIDDLYPSAILIAKNAILNFFLVIFHKVISVFG